MDTRKPDMTLALAGKLFQLLATDEAFRKAPRYHSNRINDTTGFDLGYGPNFGPMKCSRWILEQALTLAFEMYYHPEDDQPF